MIELVVTLGIVSLLAVIAIQSILRARSTTNEATAIGNVHALTSVLHMYHAINNTFPSGWQAAMYDDAEPDYGSPSFDVPMANSLSQGYLYTYTPQPGGCATDCTGYTLTANPQSIGSLGTRAFFADQTGIVRHCRGTGTAAGMADDATLDAAPAAC